MTVLHVLRPIASWGSMTWAHIESDDHPGQPLCGAQEDERYPLRSEEIEEERAILCPLCTHAKNDYQVETIQHGQRRAYSDSHYIYNVTDLTDEPRDRETVLAYCQEHIMRSYPHDEMPSWSSPELATFSSTGPGKWRYHVRRAFTG